MKSKILGVCSKDTISEILGRSIRTGNYDLLQIIISNDVVHNLIKNDGAYLSSIFENCCSYNHSKCIKLLIEEGCKIELSDPFYAHISRFIKKCLGYKVPPIQENDKCKEKRHYSLSDTPVDKLCEIIGENNIETFKTFIQCVDVNEPSSTNGCTMIMLAAQHSRYQFIKILLEKGAKVDCNRRSALGFLFDNTIPNNTFCNESMKCLKLLLNADPDLDFLESKRYYVIKLVKELLEERKNKANEKNDLLQPQLLIKQITSCPDKKICRLLDGSKIKLLSDNYSKEIPIAFENVDIELSSINDCLPGTVVFCQNEKLNLPNILKINDDTNYYLLPVGIIVNGEKLNAPAVCKFSLMHVST
jgi:hypothetical protein